jgi:short-subunit dehydrogenase
MPLPVQLQPLLTLLGAVSLAKLLWTSARLLKWYAKTPTNLAERYGAGDGCWAVVTGASSGIGEAYAHALAKDGFNVIVSARREDRLQQLVQELKRLYNCKAEYIVADFANFAAEHPAYMQRVEAISHNDVALVVHMAGNSDLAAHFTDKSLERNLEIEKTCVESTLIVMQLFCAVLAARGKLGGIITSGALTASFAKPGNCTSSANKHYVRALSSAAAMEFAGTIDILLANPIAVQSEILVKPTRVAISAARFARGTLNDLGQAEESTGFWGHDAVMALLQALPTKLAQARMYTHARLLKESELLSRPVDLRPLRDKFPPRARLAASAAPKKQN